jgi:putative membrane protein
MQRLRRIALAGCAVLSAAGDAYAHGDVETSAAGEPSRLSELPWSGEWWIWLPLVASLGFYLIGLRRVWSRATPARRRVHRMEAAAYMLGWVALAAALVSPLHPWGRLLFSAHMAQHEILMVVAAPLLVLGRPLVPFSHALSPAVLRSLARIVRSPPLGALRRLWTTLTLPLVAWIVHAVALWIWHLPQLFEATIDNEWIHFLQHASFFGTALLFWWAIVRERPGKAGYGAAILYLFTTAAHSGALGALLSLARRSFYPAYATTTAAWGLTPLEDQQLGGLLMWVPAGAVYAVAALALLAAWMRDSEQHAFAGRRVQQAHAASIPATEVESS